MLLTDFLMTKYSEGAGLQVLRYEVLKCLALDTTKGRYSHLQQRFQNFFEQYYRCKPDFFSVRKARPKENIMQESEQVLIGSFGIIFGFNVSNIAVLHR